MPQPGDKMRKKSTGEVFQYDGTNWRSMGVVPQGAQPAPQYGQGAYQTDAGDIMAPAPKGGFKMLKQGGKLTEAQAKDGYNAKRMLASGKVVSDIEATGYDAGGDLIPGWLPFRDKKRAYTTAEKEWADAQLRLTSGAQAPPAEMEQTIGTYFPKWGDPESVRRQKAEMRAREERDALYRAGPGGGGNGIGLMTGSAPPVAPTPRPRAAQPQPQGQGQSFQTPAGTVIVRPR